MTPEQPQSLQTTLDELAGFLVNIKIDMREDADLMPIFEILFPITWQVLEHQDYSYETIPLGANATCYKFSLLNQELSADSLVEHIKRLINYNEEIEEKQKQLLELQRRRETELEAEIEKLRVDFMKSNTAKIVAPSSINEVVIDVQPPFPHLLSNSQKVRKANEVKLKSESKLVVESYTPEREEDENGDEMIETVD